MARRVRYYPLFTDDVVEAAAWYDYRSQGLGESFTANVSEAVSLLVADPERFALTAGGLRYARVRRFPYIVLFDLSHSELLILGVLHTARSIDKWREQRG